MKEQLITFKTAKLAKEKGLLIPPQKNWYTRTGNFNSYSPKSPYWVITQSLLQKWLREKHSIIVYYIPSLTPNGIYFTYQIYGRSILFEESKWKETPEEALEKGLQEGLKLIK